MLMLMLELELELRNPSKGALAPLRRAALRCDKSLRNRKLHLQQHRSHRPARCRLSCVSSHSCNCDAALKSKLELQLELQLESRQLLAVGETRRRPCDGRSGGNAPCHSHRLATAKPGHQGQRAADVHEAQQRTARWRRKASCTAAHQRYSSDARAQRQTLTDEAREGTDAAAWDASESGRRSRARSQKKQRSKPEVRSQTGTSAHDMHTCSNIQNRTPQAAPSGRRGM